ncbi:MAG: transposase [Flavobacteriales bacterium Tduv]
MKGQATYNGISLFKMVLLSNWYDLSDIGTEELVKNSINYMRFCGFRLEDNIPDHTTLYKVCNEIIVKKAYKSLLKKMNKELEKNQTILKTGVIVDANITVRPFLPRDLLST